MRDKAFFKNTMLSLELAKLGYSQRSYREYLGGSVRDRSEPADHDQMSHESFDADLAQAFDCPLHTHAEALEKLQKIDFGPKSVVEEGALVKFGGQWFVIAVATSEFSCDGVNYMGISAEAPIYSAIEGKQAGESFEFNGASMTVEEVA